MELVEDVEVIYPDQMEQHGDHQDMVMSPSQLNDQGEEDSGMVMMGSQSMLISDNKKAINYY